MKPPTAPRPVVLAALLGTLLAIPVSARQLPAGVSDWEVRSFDLLDNGDFAEDIAAKKGIDRVAWWRTSSGRSQLERQAETPCLRTGPGEWASQPIAAHAPLASGIVIRGECRGEGRLQVVEGDGTRTVFEVGGTGWSGFEISLAELEREVVPRLEIRLSPGEETAWWRGLSVDVPLPAPSVEELRQGIIAELDWIFRTWEEHGGDSHGTRDTAFISNFFDVLTGEPTNVLPGGHNIFTDLVLRSALAAPEVPGWSERASTAVADVLELGFHPGTGLPRSWDCFQDQPLDSGFVEVATHLGFLLDVAEEGPEELRDRARLLAVRAGETVLARGLLPDGEVCAKLRSSDGEPNSGYSQLRRLDLPAQLARLSAMTGREDFLLAALEGIAALEYTHAWAGSWEAIDPGFDDNYGHYGARSLTAWRAAPEAEPFRRLTLSGVDFYSPLWANALRHGGNVAADQVRCWEIFGDVAELAPDRRGAISSLLRAAMRSHLKGMQLGDGTWVDVTIFDFEPKLGLQVGDTLGVPQNLLSGLARLHDPELAGVPGGVRLEEVRSAFAAVLLTTRGAFRREFGYLPGRFEQAGTNESVASLRLAVGLVGMLERL